eukprot:2095951-Heterocapsa_arctica.AAC.1
MGPGRHARSELAAFRMGARPMPQAASPLQGRLLTGKRRQNCPPAGRRIHGIIPTLVQGNQARRPASAQHHKPNVLDPGHWRPTGK